MLRIHFTGEDLSKVRVAAGPDPLWETVFSIFRVRFPGPNLIFGEWRRATDARRGRELEMLMPLLPGGYFPDFLTPPEGADGLAAGLEALRRTPARRIRTELDMIAKPPRSSWVGSLAAGDAATLGRVADAMRARHDAVVAPIWPEACAHIEADRARRARALLDGGCDGLLRSYQPLMRWQPPVLEIESFSTERDLHLDGRGLVLVPAYLSWSTVDVLFDPGLRPILVYPIERTVSALPRPPGNASIAALIGSTRAAVLEAVGAGMTTSELSRRVGVSAASISAHTAVLREAGLLRTTRIGKAVLHTTTPLGVALLD